MSKEEIYIELERQFRQMIENERKNGETALEMAKTKYEFELSQLKLEIENVKAQVRKEVEEFYNVKNTNDVEAVKSYYEEEIRRTKEWYEGEIQRREEEQKNKFEQELKEKTEEINKNYELILKNENDRYQRDTTILSKQLTEQKRYYEQQLKPFEKIMKGMEKLNKKKEKKGAVQIESETAASESSDAEETIKVSVIMPIYNVGKYLRQSLDSVLNQTLKELEVICVNDGSTDDSYEILEEYRSKDKRVKVIHKENKGTGAARNDGLRLASGECIGFVDPDDFVKPDMYEKLYGIIKEKNVEIAMCMPDGYDEKNKVIKSFPYFVDDNFSSIPENKVFNRYDISPFDYPMCVWNKLYTKELFDRNGIEFIEGLDFEDHSVIFGTLLTAERMYFIREKLYVYRYNREGSILHDNNRRLIDHIEVFDKVEELMRKTDTYKDFRKDFLKYKVHNILYYYGMIKEEYKEEYYEKMLSSMRDTEISEEEKNEIINEYPDIKELL